MFKLWMFSSERVAPGCFHPANLWPVVLIVLLFTPSNFLQAQSTPATIQLSYIASGPVTANQTITLSANVTNNGTPVTAGSVTFYEGQAAIGTAPLNTNGVASLNTAFPPGNYTLTAHYNGSAQAGPGSSSPANNLTVTGVDQLALGVTGTSMPYTLTATLTTNLAQGATGGKIKFTDTTSGQTLGTADMDLSSYQYQTQVDMTGPLGDFNGDGRTDSITTTVLNNGTQFVYLVNLANANGTTTQVVSQPFGSSSDANPILAVGDFNNDGKSDLLVQDTQTNVLTVLLSQGNGQFTIAGQMTIPSTAAVVGDFNNDGNLDVIAGNSNGLEFYAGDGAGHLAAGQTISTSIPDAALVADYNQDHNLDFFSAQPLNSLSFSGTSLYEGAGNGTTFTQQPQTIFGAYPPPANVNSIVSADFNGDGIPDIAFADNSTVTVLLGNGNGAFYPSQLPVNQIGTHSAVRLSTADINADGYEDIVAFVQDQSGAQAPWNMVVLSGIGNGVFNPSGEASSNSTGAGGTTYFPNPPVAFAFPTLGEPLATQSPLLISEPFLATGSTTRIAATLTGVTMPPGPAHTIVATYDGPGYTNGILPTATSNSIQLSSAGGTGGGIYYTQGFTPGSITTNGSAVVSNGVLQLTDGNLNDAASAFAPSAVNVQSFTTTFYFQLLNAQADGFTFTLQNVAPQALGGTGGSLGYAGIPNSVALKFDLFDNAGEGNDSIGVYTNGAMPTVPATDMTASGVNLHSGNLMQAQLIYDGKNLHVTVTDMGTEQSFQQTFAIDIPGAIGSPTAYVGFTAATGGLAATQNITNWTYAPLPYYPNFSSDPALLLNQGAIIRGTTLHLIDSGVANEARSAWFANPVPVQQFTCDFTFSASNAIADGLTFTIQNAGPTLFGPSGGGLGYGPDAPGGAGGIPNSVAVKFDLYSNAGEGNDSTGLYSGGASPTVPAIDLSSTGINLHSEDPINAHMVYDGTTLTVTLLDTVTQATATQTYTVSIPALVGANVAYVGFTAATGGLSASEDIDGWTYLPTNTLTSPVKTY